MMRPPKPPVLGDAYFRKPSPARMWNYLQGGDDNYPLDRSAGDMMASAFPDIFYLAKQTRKFLMRAAHYVAAEGGVRQFMDIGCGLPGPRDLRDLHEVVQEIHPDARVVYVDSDPVVLAHAQAWLISSTPEGVCTYLEADVHDPETILAEAAETLDLDRPTAICLLGILGHVADFEEACAIVDRLVAAVPSGSYLIVADGFDDGGPLHQGVADRNTTGIDPYHLRRVEQFRRYLRDLEIIEPDIGPVTSWRPDPTEADGLRPALQYGGVARKP